MDCCRDRNPIPNDLDDVKPLTIESVNIAFCLYLNFERFHNRKSVMLYNDSKIGVSSIRVKYYFYLRQK